MRLIKYFVPALLLAAVLAPASCARQRGTDGAPPEVVTTIFPLYDFSRRIAGDRAKVVMLVPPGVEAHLFEPKPADMMSAARASVFVYTGAYMEPWAAGIINAANNPRLLAVEAGKGCQLLGGGPEEGHFHGGADPHIWLDFSNARIMADNIAAALGIKDPANAAFYKSNAALLKDELAALDRAYSDGLKNCASRTVVHGGHFAFGYLARRYGLEYVSAYGISPDAEPSPGKMMGLVKTLKGKKGAAVFYEDMVSPKIAETVSRETGAAMLHLNAGHEIGVDDFRAGRTFTELMRENLKSLRAGLGCTD